jgi:hypothetical protein
MKYKKLICNIVCVIILILICISLFGLIYKKNNAHRNYINNLSKNTTLLCELILNYKKIGYLNSASINIFTLFSIVYPYRLKTLILSNLYIQLSKNQYDLLNDKLNSSNDNDHNFINEILNDTFLICGGKYCVKFSCENFIKNHTRIIQ